MQLVCVGQSAYDITYVIHEDLKENQKYRIYEKQECIGAPAANAACLCAKWGIDTALIARLGNDLYGSILHEELEKQGVNTAYLLQADTISTPVSTIIAHQETGSRTIFNCPDTSKLTYTTYPEACDVLLLDGHELTASIQMITRFPQAISILDAGSCNEETKVLAKLVDHLVCSQDFAYQYTGISIDLQDASTILQTFCKLKELNQKQVVVTIGDQGCLFEKDGQILHIPAYQVASIDTTGAGDIFHGAYAYGICKGWKLEKILAIASMSAALSTTKLTGNLSIPSMQEVACMIQLQQEQKKSI